MMIWMLKEKVWPSATALVKATPRKTSALTVGAGVSAIVVCVCVCVVAVK